MQELIKVATNVNGEQVVSARELHKFLELDKTQISRWLKSNIIENDFAVENEDWVGVDISVEGNLLKDYAIKVEFAKKIAMITKSKKGNEIRDYFIEMEKIAKELAPKKEFTMKELLLAQLAAIERAEKAEKTVAILTHVSKTYTSTEIGKELGFRSAIDFNNYLCNKKIQFKQNGTWILYSKYAEMALVQIKQEVLDNGKVIYHRRWTQIGREFLAKL